MPDPKQKQVAKHGPIGLIGPGSPAYDAKGHLNRTVMRWIVENPLPTVRLGFLSTKRDDDGMPVDVMLVTPESQDYSAVRDFAVGVKRPGLRHGYSHLVMAAEAINIRSQHAHPDSWVLHLSHRAYHETNRNEFDVLSGILLRVDAAPIELYEQLKSPEPIQRSVHAHQLENYTRPTTIAEAVDMTGHVQYGELHVSRKDVPEPARFYGLYARGAVHRMQPREWPNEPRDYPLLC